MIHVLPANVAIHGVFVCQSFCVDGGVWFVLSPFVYTCNTVMIVYIVKSIHDVVYLPPFNRVFNS